MKTVLQIQDNCSLQIPWAEYIAGNSTEDYSWSVGEQQCTFKIIINWTDLQTAFGQILGYSFYDKAANALKRVTPMRHPRFYWMRATRITSVQTLQFVQKGVGSGKGGPIAQYDKMVLTISFTTPGYEILEDAQVSGEYQRFVTRMFQPTSEIISVNGSGFQFNAGAPTGIKAAVPTGFVVTKTRITLKWHLVPDDYLFGPNGSYGGGVPAKAQSCIGKTNNAVFLGFPVGTLLCEAPAFEPVMQAVDPATCLPNFQAAGLIPVNLNYVPRAWNVTIPLVYFDPPFKAPLTNVGHSSAPWTDGYWYPIVSVTAPNNPLYGTGTYADIFTAQTT